MYEPPKKLDTSKKIELGILIFLIIWTIIFAINYFQYSNSKDLIFAICHTKKYSDGSVRECTSLGYVYRSYNRNAIKKEEFVPFWVLRKNPEAKNALPETLKDYDVPKNNAHDDKYRGLLYYYDQRGKLVGTYKCLNTTQDCNKATSGFDEYKIETTDPLMSINKYPTISLYANRFAFVDDSYKQDIEYGDNQYLRTIYLLDVVENKIIAKYEDVKFSYYDDFNNAIIDENGNAITKDYDSRKWGIVNISAEGKITQVLPFEYDSINYDIDTKFYIVSKDNKWYVYDLKKKKKITSEIENPIYDIWQNNNEYYYFKSGIKKNIGEKEIMNYKIYRTDNTPLLVTNDIYNTYETDSFIMYLNGSDKKLYFIDYTGEQKHSPIQLYFTDLYQDTKTNPAFSMKHSKNGWLSFKIYKSQNLADGYETVEFSSKIWE